MNSSQIGIWQELAMCFSLANLWFLRIWSQSLTYSPSDSYLMKSPPPPNLYYAAVLNVVGLGILFWILLRASRLIHSKAITKLCQFAFLASLLVPINALREVLSRYFPYLRGTLIRELGEDTAALLVLASGALLLIVFFRWSSPIIAAVRTTLLILVAFVPVTLGQALWKAATVNDTAFRSKSTAQALHASEPAHIRVLWIIFDELDQRITFDKRPADVHLPEFDALRRASLFATRAYLPVGGSTLVAMPTLITGKHVKTASPIDIDDLQLDFADDDERGSWKNEQSVFGKARALGFNTALVGWYHPYCRILNADLTRCYWCEMPMMCNSMGNQIGELVPDQIRSLFETSLFSPFGQSLTTAHAMRNHQEMLEDALSVAGDPSIGLALFHFQAPHAPHGYNRRTDRFDLANSPVYGYLDSLVLADKTLAKVRETVRTRGLRDRTALLISADHSYRSARALGRSTDKRVPFLLNLPGQEHGFEFTEPFDTIVTQDLVLAILRQEIRSEVAAGQWLEKRAEEYKPEP